jgi:hypothetical protein
VSGKRAARSLAVATVMLAASLSGCTSNPKPAPLPSDPPSPSASPSPGASPTPPAMPSAAQGTSAKAAKAFARFYIDAVNFASRTGDVSALKPLATLDCASCKSISHNIERIYSADGHITSEGWRLSSVSVVPGQPVSRPILELGVVQSPEVVVFKAGSSPKHFPGGKQPMTMHLVHRKSAWLVTRLDRVAS